MTDPAYREWRNLCYIRDVLCGPNAVIGSTLGSAYVPSEAEEFSIDIANPQAIRAMVHVDRCPQGHLFSAENTLFLVRRNCQSDKSGRRCKTCAKAEYQRWIEGLNPEQRARLVESRRQQRLRRLGRA